MLSLNTALSALRANQVALDVIGNNIANANTPSYHRQEVRLAEREPVDIGGHYLGQGVRVTRIHRAFDEATAAAINQNISDQASATARLQIAREIESHLAPTQGSLLDRVEKLFGELERLTAEPDDEATRSIVVRSAEQVTDEINKLTQQMNQLTSQLDGEIEVVLEEIQRRSAEILDVNVQIQAAEMRGRSPNDLLDRRDRLINELAELVDVRLETQVNVSSDPPSTQTFLRLANGQITLATEAVELLSTVDTTGQRIVLAAGSPQPIEVVSGKLGGLLTARNETIAAYQQKLDQFARGLVGAFDTAHASGLGLEGSLEALRGTRGVSDVTLPLSSLKTVVPVRHGSLYVNVTGPDGMRALHEVAIDPTTDSLEDVASRISTIDHLQAVVDVSSGQISFLTEPGHTFDFTGRLPSSLDSSGISGTSRPSVQGIYSGQANAVYSFEFAQGGTVGVTDNLTLTMRNSDGFVVATLDVGRDYEPDSPLEIGDGVQLQLTPGDVSAGDQFSIRLVSDPDTSGFLAAFGLNTLFIGNGPGSLQIHPDVRRDPRVLATTRTGHPLDSRNAQAMLNLRYEKLIDGNTLEEYLGNLMAGSGGEARDLSELQENLEVVGHTLQSERQSLSGVDPSEEAVRMLQFQRAFQAAARYLVTIEGTFDELYSILR